MPYRRLPNTDQARIRALKAVVVKGDICNVYDLAVSLKALTDARNFLTKFEAAQAYYADCFERQARAGRKHQANVKTARLYISHFIQVLNLAVIRSEVRIAHKDITVWTQATIMCLIYRQSLPWQSGGVKSWMGKTNVYPREEFPFITLRLQK